MKNSCPSACSLPLRNKVGGEYAMEMLMKKKVKKRKIAQPIITGKIDLTWKYITT